jgi:predicted nuclease with TOPRIM domain
MNAQTCARCDELENRVADLELDQDLLAEKHDKLVDERDALRERITEIEDVADADDLLALREWLSRRITDMAWSNALGSASDHERDLRAIHDVLSGEHYVNALVPA